MKVEMGESLCYSYLRHVKRCWLVQTNWKSSEHWTTYKSSDDLEAMFRDMREKFDKDGRVFKQTRTATQFMKQGEVDVVGVDPEGGVHALDVAFHEGGLLYGGGTDNRILKKLLRTYMLLLAYRPAETRFHIYFAAPKVHVGPQKELERTFSALRTQYREADWHLIINDDFAEQLVRATLDKTAEVADSTELFVRAAKLLTLSGERTEGAHGRSRMPRSASGAVGRGRADEEAVMTAGQIQPLVRDLMKTLLVTHPTLLDDSDKNNLMNPEYCSKRLGLKITNLPLLRRTGLGREVNGRDRYWAKRYGEFYVCSEWWKDDHVENASKLLEFVQGIAGRDPDHPGVPALEAHMRTLGDYAQ